MIQVLLVEDSKITRDAIESQIADWQEYCLYASIENAANAEIACLKGGIDLILMDVCTANNESGLKAAKNIRKYNPDIKVIIMTSMPEVSFLKKAREADCNGFWYKEYGSDTLMEVCNRVMHGEQVFPDETPAIRIGNTDSRNFTDREFEIIRELALGKKYNEIAAEMNISQNTVKYHVKNIFQKTGFQNALQLVSEVVEKRLILPKY